MNRAMADRILYVDDEPDLREIAVMSLELDPDFEVRHCGNGLDALDLAARWRPDLILLDVMMAPLDGPETARRLRQGERTGDIPFAFISAQAQPADIERLMEEGARAVIAKPFDPTTLAQVVRRLLPDAAG